MTVPYVVLSPGPAFDTLGTVGPEAGADPVLSIKGAKTYATDGAFNATTVSVTDHVTLFEALQGWVSGSDAVVPRELVYPPDQSPVETDERNAQDMLQSHDDAIVAAMRILGVKGTVVVTIAVITPKGPSEGRLEVGDVLSTVDGEPVADVESLRRLISARTPGEPVRIGYSRNGKADTLTLSTVASPDPKPRAIIGIQAATRSDFPIKVDIQLRDVGGPSAGLMFALGILDKLRPGSLTGGRIIAGTGEITPDGKVGAIGGIAQKMRGAVRARATVFLVPAANCPEAKGARPDGLTLVKVDTLRDALASLETLRNGGTAPAC